MSAKKHWLAILTMYFIFAFDLMGMVIVFVVFAPMIVDTDSAFVARNLSEDGRNVVLGFLYAAYPLTQFFGAPILGELSDRYGRRKVLLFSLFFTALSFFLAAFSIFVSALWLLFAARLIGGFSAGNTTVAQSSIVDLTEPRARPRYLSALIAFAGFSWIIGPYVGSVLSDANLVSWFSSATPFWVLGLIFVLLLIIQYLFIDESLPAEQEKKLNLSLVFVNLGKIFYQSKIATILLISIFSVLGWYLFQSFMAPYLVERYSFDEMWLGNIFAFFSLFWLIGGMLANLWFLKNYQAKTVLIIPIFLAGFSILSFLTFSHSAGVWSATAVANLSFAIVIACFFSLFAQIAKEDMQGKVIGFFNAGFAFSGAVAPPIAGILSRLGINIPFLFAGGLIVLSSVCYVYWFLRYRRELQLPS